MPDLTRDAEGKFIRDDTALAALVDQSLAAVIDGFVALTEPKVSRERVGAVIDRLQELRDIGRAIDPARKANSTMRIERMRRQEFPFTDEDVEG